MALKHRASSHVKKSWKIGESQRCLDRATVSIDALQFRGLTES